MAGGTSTEEGLQEGSVSTDAEHVWMHWSSAALRTSPGKCQVSTDADQKGGSARRRRGSLRVGGPAQASLWQEKA